MEKVFAEAKAALSTASLRDWLMNEISAFRSRLGLRSLGWLAPETEVELHTPEQQSSDGYWWFVWTLNHADIQAALEDLEKILQLAETNPQLFGASAAEVRAAFDLDGHRDRLDFEIPDNSGDGNDPTYVLCSLLAFKRLLKLAVSDDLQVVHFRFSHRPRYS